MCCIDKVLAKDVKEALMYFQQFIMVLKKLQLNLSNEDFAFKFNISQSTVSRYNNKWINGKYG